MTLEEIKNEVKQRISCIDYLDKSKNDKYCCPKCGSGTHGPGSTGAVEYYPDTNTWYCFSCKAGGDIISLYQQQTGEDFKTALQELAATIGLDTEAAERPTSGNNQSGNKTIAQNANTAQKAATGPTAYFADPDIVNEGALYVQDTQEAFITIGPMDMLAIQSAGGVAVSLNRADKAYTLLERLKDHPTNAALIVALDDDGDEDTARAAQALIDGLDRLGIAVIRADICGRYEDAAAALEHDKAGFTERVERAKKTARERKAALEKHLQQPTGPAMVDAFLQTIQTRRYEPMPTGIADLDKALSGGFMRQQLVLLGAAPGAGKTALAAWIFEGMAKRGTDCLFLNLEMSREQLLARSLSRIANTNGDKITPAEILQGYSWNEAQREAVTVAAEEYKKTIAPHLIYNPEGLTPKLDSIMEYAEREANRLESAGHPAPLLVVDYLQVIQGEAREDKIALIQRAIQLLKDYAIRHNTVVFAIMAQNRDANKSGVSSMESGRDTSNIEYGADILLALDFTQSLDAGTPVKDLQDEDMNRKTLRVQKSRFSRPNARVDLYFDGESMTFDQLERRQRYQQKKASPRK